MSVIFVDSFDLFSTKSDTLYAHRTDLKKEEPKSNTPVGAFDNLLSILSYSKECGESMGVWAVIYEDGSLMKYTIPCPIILKDDELIFCYPNISKKLHTFKTSLFNLKRSDKEIKETKNYIFSDMKLASRYQELISKKPEISEIIS